jgi:hypothetical protein
LKHARRPGATAYTEGQLLLEIKEEIERELRENLQDLRPERRR